MKGILSLFVSAIALLLSGCAPTPLPTYSGVPDFTLTERSGRQVMVSRDLPGKIWIADFIFTRCAGICPTMSENMQKLQDRLPKEIQLVSFTVDPENDTPQVLTEYAKRYNADPERWWFLTGDPEYMQKLSIEGFKLALDPTDGTEAEPITHSSRFVLVDRDVVIRGYYGTEDPDALDRLAADVEKLLEQ